MIRIMSNPFAFRVLAFCAFFVAVVPVVADDPAGLRVVAHRGLLRHAPENTLGNFRACLELRLGFEFDVEKTKDGALICIHDVTVDRTTNGTGKVAELTLEQIRRFDAGRWFDLKFDGERTPTVAEVLSLIAEYRKRDVLIAVDLKAEGIEHEVAQLAEKHGVLDRLLFIGRAISEPAVRERIRKTSPKAHVAALANDPNEFAKALAAPNADWVYLRFLPTKSQADEVHRAGKRIFLAGKTVSGDEPDNWRRAMEMGVDGVLTDYPLELAAKLREHEKAALTAIRKFGGKVALFELDGTSFIEVDLDFTGIADADLAVLADISRLGKLYLNGTKVTDAGMTSLARCRNLRTLDLRKTPVTGSTMKELETLDRLHTLYLTGSEIGDAGLREIAELEPVEILNLRETKVTDAGMALVASMKKLKTLNITSTKVTDAGIRRLTPMRDLETLYLNHTPITDASLESVAKLKSLHTLNLRGTPITDAGVKAVSQLTKLRTLFLPGTRITDTGLNELSAFPDLQSLSLDATAISDAGLRSIAKVKSLENLYLAGTKITDAGLRDLTDLGELRYLDLRDTGVTESGVSAMKNARPQCQITR